MATKGWKNWVQKSWVQSLLGAGLALFLVFAVYAFIEAQKEPPTKMKSALIAVGYPEIFQMEEYQKVTKVLRAASKKNFDYELPFRGVKLLSQADLKEQSRLLLVMAGLASEDRCAAMWRGDLSPDSMVEVYDAMRDEDLLSWARIMKKAATLALKAREWPQIDADAYYDALTQVVSYVTQEERARFETILSLVDSEGNSQGATDRDACWAFKTLHESLPKADPVIADTVLRSIGGATRFVSDQ